MKMPCDKSISCPVPTSSTGEGYDWPIANFSSEAPDREIFISPVPGWNARGCDTWCLSYVSQAEADLCAKKLEAECIPDPSILKSNTDQTCIVYCEDGTPFSYTVMAGKVVQSSQALADEVAKGVACQEAAKMMVCIVTPGTGGGGGGSKPGGKTPDVKPGHGKPVRPPRPNSDNPGGGGYLGNQLWICAGDDELSDDPWFQVVGGGYTEEVEVSGGEPMQVPSSGGSYTISIQGGTIPTGATFAQFSPTTAGFTGMMAVPGSYDFTVQADDGNGGIKLTNYHVDVFGIDEPDLPDGHKGQPYSNQLTTSGGTMPVTYSLGSDAPGWMSMTDLGLITGTPDQLGGFTFTVTITDNEGAVCEQKLSMSVICPDIILVPTVGDGCKDVAYSGAVLASGGNPPYKFSGNSFGSMPDGITMAQDGQLSGTPTTIGTYTWGVRVVDADDCFTEGTVTMDVNLCNEAQTYTCPGQPGVSATTPAGTYAATGDNAGYPQSKLNEMAMNAAFNAVAASGNCSETAGLEISVGNQCGTGLNIKNNGLVTKYFYCESGDFGETPHFPTVLSVAPGQYFYTEVSHGGIGLAEHAAAISGARNWGGPCNMNPGDYVNYWPPLGTFTYSIAGGPNDRTTLFSWSLWNTF